MTMMYIVIRIAANTMGRIMFSPAPRIIGIGPIKKIRLRDSFSPETRAAKTKIITPINISIKPRRNIFINGI